ncbi:MAG: LysM peptidoglycan-binding domain-containing protein, partial [Nitrospinae bacterium]|nr:LysM peptidoglycan-binding domain-containing protein [Nitrospinota bacterium]
MNKERSRHISVSLITILLGGYLHLPTMALADADSGERPPKRHIVEKGDTLWEIANKYLKDPFKWREIWEANKYIDDPNLIFPGDPIDFIKGKKILPPPEEKVIPSKGVAKKVLPSMSVPPSILPSVPTNVPITTLSTLVSAGYIIDEERSVGAIFTSPEKKDLLSEGDTVYIDIGNKDVTIGRKFTIYRYISLVSHPVTNDKIGHLVKILGALEVTEVQEDMSIASIIQAYDVITRGDKLLEYQEIEVPMIDPNEDPIKKDIEGYIIETKDHRMNVGKGDVVYIDSGSEDGISPGDIFVAYQKGGIRRDLDKEFQLPKVIIGELQVISVREKTSTA